MMSLWDALRMNMMISYQELVRTFLRIFPASLKKVKMPPAELAAVGLTARRRFHRLYKNFQCHQHFLWLINMLLDDFNNG